MLLNGISIETLDIWITSFFNFFRTPLFTVGSITFSFYDVFIGGVVLGLFGYAMGSIICFVKDRR